MVTLKRAQNVKWSKLKVVKTKIDKMFSDQNVVVEMKTGKNEVVKM